MVEVFEEENIEHGYKVVHVIIDDEFFGVDKLDIIIQIAKKIGLEITSLTITT
jgi:hypothetical protein